MLNQVVLVGRIVNKTKLGEDESNKKIMKITIEVPRGWKNCNGEYDNDLIEVMLYSKIAENANNYLETGTLVGIKGRLAKLENEILHIVGEKITYLSSGENNHDKSL